VRWAVWCAIYVYSLLSWWCCCTWRLLQKPTPESLHIPPTSFLPLSYKITPPPISSASLRDLACGQLRLGLRWNSEWTCHGEGARGSIVSVPPTTSREQRCHADCPMTHKAFSTFRSPFSITHRPTTVDQSASFGPMHNGLTADKDRPATLSFCSIC